jgi:putative OmpL-like beta-barrel porin-2
VIGATLEYGGQKFEIAQPVDIPKVNYAQIEPGIFFKYPLNDKIVLGATAKYMLVSKTGEINTSGMTGYGGGKASGYEITAGGDYQLTKNLFARAELRLEQVTVKFNNNANTLATMRDADAEQDVFGAKDMYIGAAVSIGYLY